MAVNRRFLNWGVFLVAVGAVILVATSDAIDRGAVDQALRLWPIAVIVLGIGLLLRRTRFGFAGGMLAAAMPGLLLGGLIVAAPPLALGCGHAGPVTFASRQGTFDGSASVDLTLACGELTVTTAPGNGWQLETGSNDALAADVSVAADRLIVDSPGERRHVRFLDGGDAWRITLPTAHAIDLEAEVDAGRGRLDLAGAQISNARLAVNAGDMDVDLTGATLARLSMNVNAAASSLRLPSGNDLAVELAVNAGSLRICVPNDLGVRIRESAALGYVRHEGLVRYGDAWESPNYASAGHHADVTISVNVGSVDVNPVGGCQ